MKQLSKKKKILLIHVIKTSFWFLIGAVFGFFFLISFTFLLFQRIYSNVVYPGVSVNGVTFGGKTRDAITSYFEQKNTELQNASFTFVLNDTIATVSAKDIDAGYNSNLLADQAYAIGRSQDIFSNISLAFQGYMDGINLPSSYTFSEEKLFTILAPLIDKAKITPIDALFTFQNNRVIAFRPSSEGQEIDEDALSNAVALRIPSMMTFHNKQTFTISVPLKTVKPKISTNDANKFGIKELIGFGTSLYQHSIPSRIYNISLAATRLNGVLIAPDEEFSFDKALGDVSAYTGYQQAYIIQNGRTVLGDGGGVCQVSTTFFRALLNAGLPITERHAHDYRVGYYEEDSPPGIDATVYVPSVDLKFKNDTGHYILIQSVVDPNILRLTFYLYGTKDGRQVSMTTPVVSGETPPPTTLYQDDPTLPQGTVKQVDFSAWGAHVSFSRTVTKNGKVVIQDTFVSNYQPWRAIYLVGTKT